MFKCFLTHRRSLPQYEKCNKKSEDEDSHCDLNIFTFGLVEQPMTTDGIVRKYIIDIPRCALLPLPLFSTSLMLNCIVCFICSFEKLSEIY